MRYNSYSFLDWSVIASNMLFVQKVKASDDQVSSKELGFTF